MAYPSTYDVLPTNRAPLDTISSAADNAVAAAINAIESELGLNPSGSDPTVAARLDTLVNLINLRQLTSQKDQPNGYPGLDAGGKVASSALPAIALSDTFQVNSQAAQLALVAQQGDVAIRSDQNKSYIHNGGTSGTMADWTELLTPTGAVLSVAGRTGAVLLVKADIGTPGSASGIDLVDNTPDSAKPVSTAQQAAIDAAGRVIPRVSLSTASKAANTFSAASFGVMYETSSTLDRSITIPRISTFDAQEGAFFYARNTFTPPAPDPGALTIQGEIAGMIENPVTQTIVNSITVPPMATVMVWKRVQASDLWAISGTFV